MAAAVAKARHFEGDPNASVTLITFGDYSCGYCGKWARDTLPQIREKYVESGQVQMAHINYPILGPGSIAAAQASECAARQDNFWEYSDLLYANQAGGFDPDNLKAMAAELDMDPENFEQCLADSSDLALLQEDLRFGQMLGVRGTPAFLVNGMPVVGALPFEDFDRVIQAALNGQL
jgi:protein-disulfide isomerase